MAKKQRHKINGWINLNKPAGIGSTHALSRVKRAINPAKAGHAGTLDPLADGILPLALGEATKTVPFMQDRGKAYRFTVKWGAATDTDDSDGTITNTSDHRPSLSDIESIMPDFIGDVEQVPPRYSAVKIDGQRAYDLAREGAEFEIKTRLVRIDDLRCISSDSDSAVFECYCGKGTYVRSLARDMALELDTFGHVTALQRFELGPMALNDAISLDFFDEEVHIDDLMEVLLPVETVLDDIPDLPISDQELSSLRQGRVLTFVSPYDIGRLKNSGLNQQGVQTARITAPNGDCAGLVEVTGVKIQPQRIFNL